ncbi:hypothetical protein [Nitrospira sp. Nam74]
MARGVILEANRVLSEMLHYPVEPVIGKPLVIFGVETEVAK